MGISHLDKHTGQTKKIRTQETAPTDPTPVVGDVYIDNTTGSEAIGIYNGSGWIYLSLKE